MSDRRDPYAAIEILAGHLRDWHDEQHPGAWADCQENECAETRAIVGDAAP